MFARFTEQARQVVLRAQREARALGHGRIGTEHVLLGLLDEDAGIAFEVLDSLGLTHAEAATEISEITPPGDEVAAGQIPFTPRMKRVLELALREALTLGDNFIGPEHVLLGLAREGEGVANHVLRTVAASDEAVRDAVLERVPR